MAFPICITGCWGMPRPFALALQAQNYVCTVYQSPPGQNTRYLLAQTDGLMRGTLAIFEDSACQTQTDSVEASSRGWAYASSRGAAEALCRSSVARLSSSANPSLWRCVSGARRGLSSNLLRPARPTGETLMQGSLLRLSAVKGLDSGIHFQRVREAGIGIRRSSVWAGWTPLMFGAMSALATRSASRRRGAPSSWTPPTCHAGRGRRL